MPQISIIVEYDILEGREGDFTSLMKDHARRTLFEERGCLRFDVMKPFDEAGQPIARRLMLSELYADEAALEVHRASPHLEALRIATDPMVTSKRVVMSHIIGSPEEEGLTPDQLNAANDG